MKFMKSFKKKIFGKEKEKKATPSPLAVIDHQTPTFNFESVSYIIS